MSISRSKVDVARFEALTLRRLDYGQDGPARENFRETALVRRAAMQDD
jgi:hypothetical protein